MLAIKEELQNLLVENKLSMRKLVCEMRKSGYGAITIGGLSKMLKSKSIKFEKVQEIIDFLGYEIKIVKKENLE